MITKINSVALLIISSIVFLFTACSNEPSASEIKAVLQRDSKPVLEMLSKKISEENISASTLKNENTKLIMDVKNIGCKEDGDSENICNIAVKMSNGDRQEHAVISARFIKINYWTEYSKLISATQY